MRGLTAMMFMSFRRADSEGQYLPTISVEVKFFEIHAGTRDDELFMDITHTDNSVERHRLGADPYKIKLAACDEVYTIAIVPYPTSGEILKKQEWQERMKPWKVSGPNVNQLIDFIPSA